MVKYNVEVSPEFKEKFHKLDNSVQIIAKKVLEALPNRNHKNDALTGDLIGFYSHHFLNNKFRIIYTINDNLIKILAIWIGKRDENFYKDLKKYLKRKGQLE